jgi:hypothetical protein
MILWIVEIIGLIELTKLTELFESNIQPFNLINHILRALLPF